MVLGGDALRIKSGGDLRIYNNDNSGSVIMYCDTGGTMSIGGNLDVTGDITAYRTGSSAANNTGVIYLNSARNRYLYYNGSYYELNGAGLSVGGDLTATGDITAFASDIRLKTDIEPIQNSLQKVLELNGFTYRFNEKGEELGFDSSKKQVGVSAQEVQSVLPEAVAPAPANEEYLTVKYEKLVPLLIEAIKELKSEIEELKKSK